MKNFFLTITHALNLHFGLPFEGRFVLALKVFSRREKYIFFGAIGVLIGTTIILLALINRAFMVETPVFGGTLVEGVLNTPAHINPLLATSEIGSEADRDLSALIYSGLLRADGKGGFIPDLAESYKVSQDGLLYTFILKKDLVWHDGKKITADDIVYTIKTTQDSRAKSPKRASFDGVDVEKIDDLTVLFTLKKPYAPFLEHTTTGILPAHIWKTIEFNRFDANKYNREPIGSGPYKIDSIETTTKDGDDIPVSYTLKAFNKFALGKPNIKTVKIIFYKNEGDLISALKMGKISAVNSISPERIIELDKKVYNILRTPLPRVLAVFFNQNQAPIFADVAVRKALALSLDKQAIIDKTLLGYGIAIDSPIPPGALGYKSSSEQKPRSERLANAKAILEKSGWKFDDTAKNWTKKIKKETSVLKFSLATSESPELKTVSNEIKMAWAELGVPVEIQVFATGDLKETIIRPRKFDTLFFGQVLGRSSDPFPFWHSSQRLDPGLNITSYTNTLVDKILDQARTETDATKRVNLYHNFIDEIEKDTPAVFLYAPEFLYVAAKKIRGIKLGSVTVSSERFLNIHEWYIDTDNVWKLFVRETNNR